MLASLLGGMATAVNVDKSDSSFTVVCDSNATYPDKFSANLLSAIL